MKIKEYTPFEPMDRYIEAIQEHTITDDDKSLIFIADGTFYLISIVEGCLEMDTGGKTLVLQPGLYLLEYMRPICYLKSSHCIFNVFRCKAFAYKQISKAYTNLMELQHIKCLVLGRISDQQILERIYAFKEYYSESVRDKVNYILDRKGNVSMIDMQEDFCISKQGLHKQFKENIGVSPKYLAQIWKMNFMLSKMIETNSTLEAALAAGYFDQSHGLRNLKKWLGLDSLNTEELNLLLKEQTKIINNRFSNVYDPSEKIIIS